MTGDTIRVVQPAEVVGKVPWVLEDNKSSGLRLTYDVSLPYGKGMGNLTVRVCWRSAVFRDEAGFVESHCMLYVVLMFFPKHICLHIYVFMSIQRIIPKTVMLDNSGSWHIP